MTAPLHDSYEQAQRARSRKRVSSRGYDPVLGGLNVGVGVSDLLQSGLRVPYAPTGKVTGEVPILVQPYLFQLCSIGVGKGLWVTGLGQLSVIGDEQGASGVPLATPIFPNVIQQRTAGSRFSDCKNIRWGLRQVRKPAIPWSGRNVLNTDSFTWRWTDGSGLIYETATFLPANLDKNGKPDNYLLLTNYTAPAAPYVFPGRPVGGDLGSFDSLDFPWGARKSSIEPTWVKPGGFLVFYALVDQTNTATRAVIQVPGSFPLPTTGMPENAFVGDFTDAQQYAVGGWLEVEQREGDGAPIGRRWWRR